MAITVEDILPRRRPRPAISWRARLSRSAAPELRWPAAGWGKLAERTTVFLVPLAVYLAGAALLTFKYHAVGIGDAGSRLANGYYVFFSRDPHLAAIGFVWNPLTSVAEMPLMLLKGLWPALTQQMFAAAIMSAIFMAGSAYQMYRFLEDLGYRAGGRLLMLGCFLANPMILFYGTNGMSEALFTFTIVGGARAMARWLVDGRTRTLISAGVWLAFGYAARNEAAMTAAIGSVCVLAVTYLRADGTKRARRYAGATDAVLFVLPFALTFLFWAIVSYLIVGHFFEQFSSIYGTSSQIKASGGSLIITSKTKAFGVALKTVETLAPLLPVAAIAGLVRWARDRDARVLAVLAFPGGVMLFEVAAFTTGSISIAYRYFIYTVPLMAMLVAYAVRPLAKSAGEARYEAQSAETGIVSPFLAERRRGRQRVSALFGLVGVIALIPGVFTTESTMATGSIFKAERTSTLDWAIWPNTKEAKQDGYRTQLRDVMAEARKLDAMHLPHGALMLDNFEGCIPQLILSSNDPKQFAIPNDEDYVQKQGVPYQQGVRYFFVSDPHVSLGALDALNRRYPGLYDNGQGLATLVYQVTMSGCLPMRLYKLIPATG